MNKIAVREVEPEECPVVRGEGAIKESYSAYLTDESRMDSQPVSAIYFPANTAQVVDAVRKIRSRGESIVVSASRTGIVGGAVGVENARIISLERMIARLGEQRFQAGVKLEDVPATASEYYPVDPTETTASLGGTAATDASGARSYHYGSTRDSVQGLTVVLADGGVLEVRRGACRCEGGRFVLARADGEVEVPITAIKIPGVKNAAGLYLKEGMDLVDLFIGSEGILGIITEVEVKTVPLPAERLFLVVYVEGEDRAIELVETIKSDARIPCLAMEYFDPNAVALLLEKESFPNLPATARCAVYLEIPVENDETGETVDELLSSSGLGGEATWAGNTENDLKEMKRFRHMVPETVNDIISSRKKKMPGLHKIATDTAVPEGRLSEFLASAGSLIEREGLEYVVFGHIGDNHLHINMLPGSLEEMQKGEVLSVSIARESVRLGGTVSAEHGIGRLKKNLLAIQFSQDELNAMKAVKDSLDPDWVLNPGVMF